MSTAGQLTSTAPAVQPIAGLGLPRWSVAGQALPAPRAGLPVPGNAVWVGPPLVPRVPRSGSAKSIPVTHGLSGFVPVLWFFGHWKSSAPMLVVWHAIGALGSAWDALSKI